MKKIRLIMLITLGIMSMNLDAQWVTRMYNTGADGFNKASALLAKGGLIVFNNYDKTAQTGLLPRVATHDSLSPFSQDNSLVSIMDTLGAISNQFNISGVSLANYGSQLLNDSEFIFTVTNNNSVFVNDVKKLDSIYSPTFSNQGYSVVKLSKSGNLTKLFNVPSIVALGWYDSVPFPYTTGEPNFTQSSAFSNDMQYLYLLYNCVTEFDTANINQSYFERNKAIVFKVNMATGVFENHWILPMEFDQVSVLGNNLILTGRSKQLNYTYSIDSTNYTRDSIRDRQTADIIIASINTTTGKYNWHYVTKIKSRYLDSRDRHYVYTTNNAIYASFMYVDTVKVGGILQGSVIPFNTVFNTALVRYSASGQVTWVNSFKFNTTNDLSLSPTQSGLGIALNVFSNIGAVVMNGLPIQKTTNKHNYIRLSEAGNIEVSLNYTFVPGNQWTTPIGVNELDSSMYVFMNLQPNENVLINGINYTVRNTALDYDDNLLVKFKATASVFPTALITPSHFTKSAISVFPNPVNSNLTFIGFEGGKKGEVKLYDFTGKLMLSKVQLINEQLDVSYLSQGIYTLIVQMDGISYSTKVIKN